MPARSLALGIVGFVATLALLAGIASLVSGPRQAGARATASPVSTAPGQPGSSGSSGSPGPAGTLGASPAPTGSPVGPGLASDAPGDPVLVGAGDIADCGRDTDEATAALLDHIPGTVFTAGDNAYPSGTAAQFRECYGPSWGRHLARTRPAPGNHDWETAGLAGYLGYFGAAAAPAGPSWYAYDLGAWHVIVLDANCDRVGGCGPDSPQGKWLADDLAATTARCTMAIWHQPRFSSGEHGNDESVAPFWRALYEAGADVVVNGHDHDYERFAPQDPDGQADEARGLREFVVGTGGAALRDFPRSAANSVVRAAVAHGVVRFVLHPASFEWRFVTTTGEFSDTGSGACH